MNIEKLRELITAGASCRLIAEVLEKLKAYNEVFVIREDGNFSVSVSSCLSARATASDLKIWRIFADDFYTGKERMLNYVESFGQYPDNYTGKRDYANLAAYFPGVRARWVGENIVIG